MTQSPLFRIFICVVVGIVLWYYPISAEIPRDGQEVFAVFIAVIVSFLLRPLPMAPMVLLGLISLIITGTISLDQALVGFGNSTVWLVVAAFLISGAVLNSGFGHRIALFLISKLGKNIFGIAYGLCGSELILGPVVPSNTARGAGIHAPIAQSLSEALGSYPDKLPDRAGAYISLVGGQANLVTAGMFLTGMAANPLLSEAAGEILKINFDWITWATGTIVPGLISLAGLPLFIYQFSKPDLRDTREVQKQVKQQYKALGKWKTSEKWMCGIFIFLIALWTTSKLHGMGTSLVAWIGVCTLFLSGTYSWDKMIRTSGAWDALIWLGGLLTMANLLKDYGFVEWFSTSVSAAMPPVDPLLLMVLLALIYFYSMYLFSMLTGHIAAFIGGFFAIAMAYSIPPLTMAALFSGFSTLCGCLTNYSSGPEIMYYGQGYVPLLRWFKVGFLLSIYHIAIWLTFGLAWWKFLGWW
ncbi:MAG: DASS family sodium-coupled anion symporter [Cyclobacteriaceae bacterium]